MLKVVNRRNGDFFKEVPHSVETDLGLSRTRFSLVPFVSVVPSFLQDVSFEREMFPDSWGIKRLVPADADLRSLVSMPRLQKNKDVLQEDVW